MFVTARFTGKGSSSCIDMDWRLCIVYTYRNGTVIRADEYFDRVQALEAAGLS
jgi:ketosteroid isomerase-like protein